MKKNRLLVFILLVLICTVARAQETEAADSVVVMGRVVNRLSGEVEPYCRVSFLHGMDTMATVVSDAAGEFGTNPMPAGSYGLSVSLRGMTLYRADLVLNSNAELYISVITDSFQLRILREVAIVAPKHQLAEQGQLITHHDDPRLWDFNYRPCFGGEAHYGGADAGFLPGQFYAPAKGRADDRIWQLFWPDIVVSVQKKKPSADEEKKRTDE